MSDSRWSRWVDKSPKKLGFSSFIKEADEATTGVNPTGTGIETPAQRAARMGLQSDGHGSYMDPNTGQIVARTVNGELVFYDQGPTGGAVSDGEGGDYKPQVGATGPTFTDPDTGMVMVPPAKPKSKEELDAVPDHVPATAPAGFKDEMRKKKEKGQRKSELVARMTQPELDPSQVDLVAKGLSGGKWERMNPKQRLDLKKKAKEMLLKNQQQEPEDSIQSRRDAVDADIAAGMDAAAAHEKTHGHDPSDKESNASLAATMGRLTKDNGTASINASDGSESLLAKDQAAAEEPAEEPAPEPEQPKGKTLDDFKKQAEAPKAEPKAEPEKKQTAFQSLSDSFQKAVDSGKLNGKDGKLSNAKYRELQERLQDPVVQEIAAEFMDAYDQLYSEENIQNFHESGNNLSSSDDAVGFLENTLGMVRNKRGKLTFGDTTQDRTSLWRCSRCWCWFP